MQVLKHLSSCAKAADALRVQVFQHPEYRDCQYLGRICLAVCKHCEKCTANRREIEPSHPANVTDLGTGSESAAAAKKEASRTNIKIQPYVM
jgi:hypothetical protein